MGENFSSAFTWLSLQIGVVNIFVQTSFHCPGHDKFNTDFNAIELPRSSRFKEGKKKMPLHTYVYQGAKEYASEETIQLKYSRYEVLHQYKWPRSKTTQEADGLTDCNEI